VKIVVTGGRDFDDIECVHRTLGALNTLNPITLLAHGGAIGADSLCATWAHHHGVATAEYPVRPADWTLYGKAAGPRRNRAMLEAVMPRVVVVFPGGRGTADCVRRAKIMGLGIVEAAPFTPEGA
jgi:hypothetical protein